MNHKITVYGYIGDDKRWLVPFLEEQIAQRGGSTSRYVVECIERCVLEDSVAARAVRNKSVGQPEE